jgi:hypothetical protein
MRYHTHDVSIDFDVLNWILRRIFGRKRESRSRDSSVGIASGLWALSIPGSGKRLFCIAFRPDMDTGRSYPLGKVAGVRS